MEQQPWSLLPEKSGVYIFKDKRGQILYIGKAKNLRRRVSSYFQNETSSNYFQKQKISIFSQKFHSLDYIPVESEFEALLLEAALIKKYQPKYNTRLKDDKSPLYIKITDEMFPRVFPARKSEGGFGPYPQAKTVRMVLRFLRRIFPYRSCPTLPKRTCLYFDLKLCPGVCLYREKEVKKAYQKTISHLKNLLSGKSQLVIKNLKKEMKEAARREEFEKAKEIRDKIQKIEYLFQKRHFVEEYLENPFLLKTLRQKELSELQRLLKIDSLPKRIEGFDVSDISGNWATGGMVVFINGEPEKSFYRRFKMRLEKTPNDVAMIKETILRRLSHHEWDFPDLILVDGGKGQVRGALEAVKVKGLKIAVVGLAKKRETLVIPKLRIKKGKLEVEFTKLNLAYDSPVLNLLKRIRDEAHRFARTYHLKLRKLV